MTIMMRCSNQRAEDPLVSFCLVAKGAFETARDSSHNHEVSWRTIPAQLFRQSELAQLSNGHHGDEENDDSL